MTKQIIFKVITAIVIAVPAYFIMTSVDKSTRITIGLIIAIPSFILMIRFSFNYLDAVYTNTVNTS
ncbi:MAG: hypothetical protein EHM58_11925 [Ignavibacteriae bacterium]|nr:MAG: hypothetical protein EHM58_11925 [Ignavibacteriota bacterium]